MLRSVERRPRYRCKGNIAHHIQPAVLAPVAGISVAGAIGSTGLDSYREEIKHFRSGFDPPPAAALNTEVLRADEGEVCMERRRNERAWKAGDPRENSPTNGIVLHDFHMRKSGGGTPPGIEPPWCRYVCNMSTFVDTVTEQDSEKMRGHCSASVKHDVTITRQLSNDDVANDRLYYFVATQTDIIIIFIIISQFNHEMMWPLRVRNSGRTILGYSLPVNSQQPCVCLCPNCPVVFLLVSDDFLDSIPTPFLSIFHLSSEQHGLAHCHLKLGSPLVDDRSIMNAVKYIVSGVVWTNRTMVSSSTDTNRTGVLAVVDIGDSHLICLKCQSKVLNPALLAPSPPESLILFDDLQARLYSLMYKYADINCTLVVCYHNGRRQLDTVLQEVSNSVRTNGLKATAAERLARSPPTKANRVQSPAGSPDFRKWEPFQTMPLVGGCPRGSPVSPTTSFRRCSIFTSITLIGSQDLAVKIHPNLFTLPFCRQ
ncbi:hypothetical protein PR048_012365 [Dryococelus australis]|uniref:Uncharacterized protein n=1 Tax=Dryococelus australis TaxID=614101 RepID=A0ABQ9HP61_9NEOP|nr:hypothetical protein PR048_012365 [Dryococelus australis]